MGVNIVVFQDAPDTLQVGLIIVLRINVLTMAAITKLLQVFLLDTAINV